MLYWAFLENKTKAASHPNIASIKTAIEEEWNKISTDSQQQQQQQQQKKKNQLTSELCRRADHRVKLKGCEKRDKYLEHVRELKKRKTMECESDGDTNCNWWAWNNLQELEYLEIRGQVKIIQTTALLRSARILRRVLET